MSQGKLNQSDFTLCFGSNFIRNRKTHFRMRNIFTFLMFSGKNLGKAEEAMKFYTSLFEDSEIKSIEHFQEGEPSDKAGTVKQVHFTLAGRE